MRLNPLTHGLPQWLRIALALACLAAAPLTGAATLPAAELPPVKPSATSAPLNLLPLPAQVTRAGTGLRIEQGALIAVPPGDKAAARVAADLTARVWRERGLRLVVRQPRAGERAAIRFARSAAVAGEADKTSEAYRLSVSAEGVNVQASGDAGLFYAAVSLYQLLTPPGSQRGPVDLPGLQVDDAPRFVWRGLMLDVARHFSPPADIEALLDQMALHKLNVLHLHLSDDQGWRFEVKRYPDLTRIGGWRTPPAGQKPPYGGFYTQTQLRALVAYAAARHITLVPEFDLPGHAQAAVAAYPQFGVDICRADSKSAAPQAGCTARPAVSVDWGVNPYLFNVDEPTVQFIQHVLDEAMAVFPSRFIHIGGDEAIKDQWKASPAVQQRMRDLGIANEEALQGWFIGRLEKHLSAKGRRLIGWDEILEGGLPPGASVMSWRGVDGAVAAAKQGHDVVLAPVGTLYFDYLQSPRADEPEGQKTQLPIERVYAFEPLAVGIEAAQAKHVLGLEAALWTEYMPSRRHIEHAIFPRIAALAEVAWSPQAARDWAGFVPRLAMQRARYLRQGVGAADSAFAVQFDIEGGPAAMLAAGQGQVRLSNQLAFGDIRYTLDGSEPTPTSLRIAEGQAGTVALRLPARLRANVFAADGEPLARVREQRFDALSLSRISSSGLTACPRSELGLRVPLHPDATDWSPVFNISVFDACWIYPQAPLAQARGITVDAARLARNYGLAHDAVKVRAYPASTPQGELEVRQDRCDGPLLARMPLPTDSALRAFPLSAALPDLPASAALPASTGAHDLCLRFTAPITGPLYAIDAVQLLPSAPPAP